MPTLSTYIVDSHLQMVPVGVAGEICVGGEGVCWGYLNRPELTEEKFVENPYINGERLYRSGDLGRYLGTGDIEYLGRMDQQV
ncbi:MAG: AMP-binding protein, partial [Candidatus Aminicenantes bacterium]|nr:AMP-binding protein [Candidatus Aminicenantes bacterium]NIM77372.1 AMP-binding protein [Candidatus Aminicenantes bacterium]NIN16674.1 AMP-binding protein [Candidatus Aminicenantes bacterium]NIN40532.1 AMP-binding protein [Candidatus Aminicenantes bacterium]NIN83352.1 AMP-binding protein [Candidatus Aminicenantes bacterium]